MNRFSYQVIDAQGRPTRGEADSDSLDSLVSRLRNQGFTVVDVREEAKAAPAVARPATRSSASLALPVLGGVSRKTITLFTRQLAATLNAGLPILRVVSVLHQRSSDAALRAVLESVGQDLQRGSSFSEALAKHPRAFDSMYLDMIRVGETGGALPQAVTRLARLLEKEATLRRKVRSALVYPSFVLAFSLLMCYALLAFLMPMFTPMFEASGMDIKSQFPITHVLMQASAVATNGRLVLACFVALVGLGFAFKMAVKTPKGQYVRDYCVYHFPLFAGMVQQAAAARFSRTFATLMQSGVPLLSALSLVAGAAGNLVVTRSLQKVAREVQAGTTISATLEQTAVFPDLLVQMAAIGEEAGTLPDMMERVADFYEEELDSTIGGLMTLIEPLTMLLIGGVVGMFVMGILLPILGISTATQSQMSR